MQSSRTSDRLRHAPKCRCRSPQFPVGFVRRLESAGDRSQFRWQDVSVTIATQVGATARDPRRFWPRNRDDGCFECTGTPAEQGLQSPPRIRSAMALSNTPHPNCPKGEVTLASAPSASSAAAVLGTLQGWAHQVNSCHRKRDWPRTVVLSRGSGPPSPTLLTLLTVLTMLTVLTVSSALVLTLIILLPVRPSRENAISMPEVPEDVCARRSQPASARGFFAHALLPGSASDLLPFVCGGRRMLRARFCSRRKRPAHRVWLTRDHAQVGACRGVGLVTALLPIPDCSNRNMERGRELLL